MSSTSTTVLYSYTGETFLETTKNILCLYPCSIKTKIFKSVQSSAPFQGSEIHYPVMRSSIYLVCGITYDPPFQISKCMRGLPDIVCTTRLPDYSVEGLVGDTKLYRSAVHATAWRIVALHRLSESSWLRLHTLEIYRRHMW